MENHFQIQHNVYEYSSSNRTPNIQQQVYTYLYFQVYCCRISTSCQASLHTNKVVFISEFQPNLPVHTFAESANIKNWIWGQQTTTNVLRKTFTLTKSNKSWWPSLPLAPNLYCTLCWLFSRVELCPKESGSKFCSIMTF